MTFVQNFCGKIGVCKYRINEKKNQLTNNFLLSRLDSVTHLYLDSNMVVHRTTYQSIAIERRQHIRPNANFLHSIFSYSSCLYSPNYWPSDISSIDDFCLKYEVIRLVYQVSHYQRHWHSFCVVPTILVIHSDRFRWCIYAAGEGKLSPHNADDWWWPVFVPLISTGRFEINTN